MAKMERVKKDEVKVIAKEGLGLKFIKDAEDLFNDIDQLVEVLATTIKANQKAPIGKYLTIEKGIQSARTSRNPKTGEVVNVPEKEVIKVKLTGIGKALIEA